MNKTKGNRRKKRIPGEPTGQKRPHLTPEPENLQTQTFRRGVISVFILFHLVAITCMALPADFPPIRNIKDLVKRVSAAGMKAVAVTDHGNLFAAANFFNEASKRDVKPIIGCEVYVAKGSRHDRGEKTNGANGPAPTGRFRSSSWP